MSGRMVVVVVEVAVAGTEIGDMQCTGAVEWRWSGKKGT